MSLKFFFILLFFTITFQECVFIRFDSNVSINCSNTGSEEKNVLLIKSFVEGVKKVLKNPDAVLGAIEGLDAAGSVRRAVPSAARHPEGGGARPIEPMPQAAKALEVHATAAQLASGADHPKLTYSYPGLATSTIPTASITCTQSEATKEASQVAHDRFEAISKATVETLAEKKDRLRLRSLDENFENQTLSSKFFKWLKDVIESSNSENGSSEE